MRNYLRHMVSVGAACLCGLAGALPATSAADSFPSFRIRQLASSQDGYYQIIELEEVGGKDGQDQFAGLALKVTNRFGITKTFVFPSNLPNAVTANKHVTIGPQGLGGYDPPRMDFILPKQFLPTDGGTIDFAGIDHWSFDAIPTDGGVLLRSGEVGPATVQNFAGQVADCCGPVYVFADRLERPGIEFTWISVAEFYNVSLDHYFVSGSQPDIDALNSGRIPGWQASHGPDGNYFPASSTPTGYGLPEPDGKFPVQSVPVCRYFIPPGSHFFSASADECDTVELQHPPFVLETRAAFYIVLPDFATGACPQDIGYGPIFVTFIPVYRLWNHREDTNHRYTTSLAVRAEMIAKGWVPEGYGPMGVAMCGADWE